MDSACSDKSAIASRVLQLHTPSMRPCTRLQNANFSSTILESFAGSLTFLAFPKADSNPKILESKSSENHKTRRSRSFFSKSTASNFNLESIFSSQADSLLSSRALRQQGVAIHKSAQADSNMKMDCHAIATALARNDRGVWGVDCHADFQSARNDKKNAASKKVDSRQTTQKSSRKQLTLESTFTPQIQLECEKSTQLLESIFSSQADPLLSSRDFRKEVVAIHKSAKVDSSVKMDCRAIATALARNDKKNAAILNEQPKDSRFCDEKPLLCKPRKEIRLAVYRHSAAQQSKVYRAKPNPPAKFN